MQFVLFYITCPSTEVAHTLAHGSVQARLAACANIMPGMTSIYEWNGALHTDQETVLILKTRTDLIDSLTKWITSNHPYTVPCILQIPVLSGNEPYLNWMVAQTGDQNDP
jgi:periplasmic divalent cation tolerance protein